MPRPAPAVARMRLALTALLLATLGCTSGGAARQTFLPPSRPAQFSLAGVPWGIASDSVTALVEPRGYNFNSTDPDGDMWFDGMLFRTPTRVYAFMAPAAAATARPAANASANEPAPGRLVKLRVVINTPDEDALTMYQEARAELVKMYGPPKETEEEYAAPYKKGDGKQLQAIRAGKATIRSYWLPNDRSRTSHVAVMVTERLVVAVDYEGPAWERESLRRRRQSASR